MPLPFGFKSLSIRSMVSYDGAAVAVTRSALTYSTGVMSKKTAPQSVRPRPMKARTCEFALIEKASASIPGMRKAMPMATVRVMFILISLGFNSRSSAVCCSAGASVMVGCSYVGSSVVASVGASSLDIHFEIMRFAFKVSFLLTAGFED